MLISSLHIAGASIATHANEIETAPQYAANNTNSELFPFHACVWDPFNKADQIIREAKALAYRWGIDLTFSTHREELIAIEEFRLGRCDGVNMLGIRAREFNSLTGSLGALGAIPSYDHLGIVIKTLSSQKASSLMRSGDFEIVGMGPAGAIFMFTRDRSVLDLQEFGGMRMSVLEDVPETAYLSKKYAITPVNSSVLNAYLKFNNGSVDLTGAPAILYELFEMYRGLEPNGGVYSEPFMHMTMQIVVRAEKLPDGIAQKVRDYAVGRFQEFVDFLQRPEAKIPAKYWIRIPQDLHNHWSEGFRQSRIELGRQGIYDPRALKLMRKVRCKLDKKLAECSATLKE